MTEIWPLLLGGVGGATGLLTGAIAVFRDFRERRYASAEVTIRYPNGDVRRFEVHGKRLHTVEEDIKRSVIVSSFEQDQLDSNSRAGRPSSSDGS